MIDVETEVVDAVADAVLAAWPEAFVTGEYGNAPAAWPAVYVAERDNTMYEPTADTGDSENHVRVLYEVNVYSNRQTGRKAECKAVAAVVDAKLRRMGFVRNMLEPTPNLDDATIYRMTGRYTAVIDKNERVYRR